MSVHRPFRAAREDFLTPQIAPGRRQGASLSRGLDKIVVALYHIERNEPLVAAHGVSMQEEK
jgi:hypothetical protein